MDEHLAGKNTNDTGNIFTIISKIPYDKDMENIDYLESKVTDEFSIKVLTVPNMIFFLKNT